MAVTAKLLKDIMTEARPIIERQMNDAKLVAGFRTVVANAGGDWGALKALIKAHVEDEHDETGDGQRVQKIRDKADSTSAYADMLGLANMNENKNIDARSYAEEKGRREADHEQPETANEVPAQDGGGTATGESPSGKSNAARPASVDAHVNDGRLTGEVSIEVVTAGETATNSNPVANVGEGANGAIAAAPYDPASRDVDGADRQQPATSGFTGEGDGRDVEATGGAAPVTANSEPFEPVAFLRQPKPLRPNCLHPDLCASGTRDHCWSCKKQMAADLEQERV